MMRKMIFVLLGALTLMACTRDFSVNSQSVPAGILSPLEKKVVKAGDEFGFKLFKELNRAQSDSNIFISPLSVSMALGMTYNGAAGETEQAMRSTLGFSDLSKEEINNAYKSLVDFLTQLDPKVALQIANSIWYRLGFHVEQAFIDVNMKYFSALVTGLDFGSPEAVVTINSWINEQTSGKIDRVISQIDPETVMFLINAIYFKGAWTYEFDKEKTVPDSFYTAKGTALPCQMMHQENEFLYYETDQFQAVDLPYGDGDFSMTIVLPKPNIELDVLIEELTPETWGQWLGSLQKSKGILEMPRFKLEYRKSLVDQLKAMGMEVAFSRQSANFTGINKNGGLFISDVIHKSFVDVNEEGTEAAAVTVVIIGRTSVGGGSSPFYMRVDRPFLFIIHENQSQTSLFMGKIVRPENS